MCLFGHIVIGANELVLLLDRALVKALGRDVNKGMGVE